MNKDIFVQDKNYINTVVNKIRNTNKVKQIEKMNGLTNRTYKVELEDGEIIVVRIPGEGTAEMICRDDEYKSTELACRLGIDTELLYFGVDGTKVMHFIENAETMSREKLKEKEKIEMVANVFRTLHNCGEDTGIVFDIFEMASNYEKIIRKNNVTLYDDYEKVKQDVLKIKEIIDKEEMVKKVPCHNDSLCENWIYGEEKLWLIDWEYAGMNDAMWDLADISIEADYGDAEDMLLLKKYFEKEPTNLQRLRFLANKLYLDYLWTLWGKTRVPFSGMEMEQYALERYIRLKENLNKFEELYHI